MFSYPCHSRHSFPQAYDDLAIRDSYHHNDLLGYNAAVGIPRRLRRHSAVSFSLPPQMDMYRRPSSGVIKFKRKGALTPGITLGEAQSHVRLSNNDIYSVHDLHADPRGRILLKIRVCFILLGIQYFSGD
jgi:hypothetical protein